ncbi:Checkpoint protein hus1 [Durusdinium trenchii]|uniref:Checkpoint protein hus1 n=1 Tax=Durusdinium trenchii TaxID=1381693 RepID=A0ABP0IQ11_9DINO
MATLELPVRVVPEPEAEAFREPALPEPEFQIELPGSLGKIRTVLERMKQVAAQSVTVEAAKEQSDLGERAWLRLAAQSEVVQIATTFPSLTLVMEGKNDPAPQGPVALQLSLKRLAEVMNAVHSLQADTHIAAQRDGP